MGRPTAEETAQRRRAVLDAARAEFLARGYRAATMDRIAASSGVSKRTLYFWHEDKSALFRTGIVEGVLDLKLPTLNPSLDLRVALMEYGAVLLPAVSTEFSMRMSQLLFREGAEFEEVRRALMTGVSIMSRPVADYLVTRGMPPEPAFELAELFMVATTSKVQKATVGYAPPPNPVENMRHLELVVGLFGKGIAELLPPKRSSADEAGRGDAV
jgi:TetR/AcrR family transcriptional repressor of mexJK operon